MSMETGQSSHVPCVDDDCWYTVVARERDELRDRLSTMTECVRIYVAMRDAQTPPRPGWLEEEIAAADEVLAKTRKDT